MVSTKKRAAAQERIAAARAAEKRRERRRWIITFAVTGALVIVIAAGAVWAIAGKNAAREAAANGRGTPPWPVPSDTADRAKAAGLTVQAMEGTARHFHAHLDVFVNGRRTPVPANLGIDASGQSMAELHTHDSRGVLHIESPSKTKRYTLGQLFQEWNVRLDTGHLGALKTDSTHTLTAYVNGKAQSGDPAAVELTPHRQIALVYGRADQKPRIPSSYRFEPGE